MKKLLAVLITSGGAILIGVFLQSAAAAPTVENLQADPSAIMINKQEQILITAIITDPSLIPNSVYIWKLDNNNRPVAKIETLHDDGLNGDKVAGDHVYSAEVSFWETSPGYLRLLASAAFRGMLRRVKSDVLTIKIRNSLGVMNLTRDFWGQNEGKEGIAVCWGNPPYTNGPQGTQVIIYRSKSEYGPWQKVLQLPTNDSLPSCVTDGVDGTTMTYYYKGELFDSSGTAVYTYAPLEVPQTR